MASESSSVQPHTHSTLLRSQHDTSIHFPFKYFLVRLEQVLDTQLLAFVFCCSIHVPIKHIWFHSFIVVLFPPVAHFHLNVAPNEGFNAPEQVRSSEPVVNIAEALCSIPSQPL